MGSETERRAWIVEALARALQRRTPKTTLSRCLYDGLRGPIQSGELAPGTRLPSSRRLAADLGVGRNTALAALDHLVAEGFVVARSGAGLHVADMAFPQGRAQQRRATNHEPALSERGQRLLAFGAPARAAHGVFVPGVPALDLFPWPLWQRLLRRHRQTQRGRWLDYEASGGHPALKAAIADYARLARNVRCTPDQILVTHGAQHAFDLIARMLADPGDVAWVEEPGYAGARAAFSAAGLSLAAVPVDRDGLDPAAAPADAGPPRLMHLTPSNQFPMGGTLSMARRLALLERARREGSWVIEDDYDSEFRYASAPLSSMQGLTAADGDRAPVLYVGTFSKTLYPGLRLGYVVLPPALIEPFRRANVRQFREGDYVVQAALAAFMNNGGYAKHVGRMRRVYAERRQAVYQALGAPLGRQLIGGAAGLQVVLPLSSLAVEQRLVAAAASEGIALAPLSRYCMMRPGRPGLVLGYGNADLAEIERAGGWLRRQVEASPTASDCSC